LLSKQRRGVEPSPRGIRPHSGPITPIRSTMF
jgi:hypothetical protein